MKQIVYKTSLLAFGSTSPDRNKGVLFYLALFSVYIYFLLEIIGGGWEPKTRFNYSWTSRQYNFNVSYSLFSPAATNCFDSTS